MRLFGSFLSFKAYRSIGIKHLKPEPDLVELRDGAVKMDLPIYLEIEENNMVAEVLQNGDPNLGDALHKVIQLKFGEISDIPGRLSS
jgi:hypothetical protein